MIPLLGFLPDADPTTPGAVVNASGVIPTERGIKAAPSAVDVGKDALAAGCRGIAVLRNLSGSARLIAGTASNLYEAGSPAWTSVASGLTLGSDDRWSFAQFGDAALAATITAKIKRSLSGAFAEVASAPKAKVIESVLGFVMALNTEDATYGTAPDRWWCCAHLDDSDWTPSVATQATTGRLVEGAGPITAGKRLGDDMVAYKGRSMFLGRYVGPPVAWRWQMISNEVGCIGQDAVLNVGTAHLFVGQDDIYMFDGIRPVSVAQGKVREFFKRTLDSAYSYRTQMLWDQRSSLAWIFYPGTSSGGVLDRSIVYHVPTGRWGICDLTVEACVNFVSPGVTYDTGAAWLTTYDGSPAVPFDSPLWSPSADSPAVVATDHKIKSLSGDAGATSFSTGHFGDEDAFTFCSSLKVRYLRQPSSSQAAGVYLDELGATQASGESDVKEDGKYDMRQTGRWHWFQVENTGAWEATAVRPSLKQAGAR